MTIYYDIVFAVSVLLLMLYVLIWHKHFDVHITLMFVLVPITNLGYVLFARAHTLEEALAAYKLTYMGGCFQMLAITFVVFSLCDIKLNRWIRTAMTTLSAVVYLSALTGGYLPIFYKSISFERVNGIVYLHKEYGIMHHVFVCMFVLYFCLSIGAMIYSYFKNNQVSRKNIFLLFFPVVIALLSYFPGRQLIKDFELIPAAYSFGMIVYLIIVYRLCLYDVADTAIDTLVQSGETGLVSIDFGFNYLGSNETAKCFFPQMRELTVDRHIAKNEFMKQTFLKWLTLFASANENNTAEYEKDGRIYLVRINYLFDGKRKRGYQLFITDDTQNRQYIKLINSYNSELHKEVEEKTAHIFEMHDNLIMSMATMVESRDNSTGGHIKRTSEGVRLLIEEIRKDPGFGLSEKFCKDIIKAAPMHDLGKIAVDDAVLRKPGRYTPEEYDKMKAHAAEGARIVRDILKNTDDRAFARIAENVAHFHHERVDGSGYPEGLKGEEIPLEARIMAIADVYDALVSKRVYKERMSFEKANAIIMEGMGSQFDGKLEPYYSAARLKLEEYYDKIGE